VLLDGIQAGRDATSDRYDNSPGKSKLIGKLQDENIRSPVRYELMNILLEIGEHADDDGMAVTHELQAGALAQEAEDGKPLVQLCSSKTASINEGASLVGSKGSSLSREDYHALVAYSTELPSPAASLAMAASAAADAASRMLAVLQDREPPGNTSIADDWADLKRSIDEAQVAAALCSKEAGEADQHAGYSEHVVATEHACQDVCVRVAHALDICEAMEGWGDSAAQQIGNAARDSIRECRVVGASMPRGDGYTQDLEPGSICTVLTIERLLLWLEQRNGEKMTRRLAMGVMTELVPAGCAEDGYEMAFCNGTRGRRKRVPTMLTPAQGRNKSYK
jgi:hypothetical protein